MSDNDNDDVKVRFVSAEEARDLALTGMSLSFCVLDIARGAVAEGSVKKIIAGTMLQSEQDIAAALENYQNSYWKEFPQASAIAQRLFEQGKVEQPRCEGRDAPSIYRAHWKEATTGDLLDFRSRAHGGDAQHRGKTDEALVPGAPSPL